MKTRKTTTPLEELNCTRSQPRNQSPSRALPVLFVGSGFSFCSFILGPSPIFVLGFITNFIGLMFGLEFLVFILGLSPTLRFKQAFQISRCFLHSRPYSVFVLWFWRRFLCRAPMELEGSPGNSAENPWIIYKFLVISISSLNLQVSLAIMLFFCCGNWKLVNYEL